jgi:hypothetical protein
MVGDQEAGESRNHHKGHHHEDQPDVPHDALRKAEFD